MFTSAPAFFPWLLGAAISLIGLALLLFAAIILMMIFAPQALKRLRHRSRARHSTTPQVGPKLVPSSAIKGSDAPAFAGPYPDFGLLDS